MKKTMEERVTAEVSPELLDFMKKKRKDAIVVEVVDISSSDFACTELHVFAADKRIADSFVQKKRYREMTGEVPVRILLPNYHLEYDSVLRFGLKRTFLFHTVSYEGIRF